MTDEPIGLAEPTDLAALVDLTVPEDVETDATDTPVVAYATNDILAAATTTDEERLEAELAADLAALGIRDLRTGPGPNTTWYVVKCTPRDERQVSVLLIGAGFDAFSPTCVSRRRIPGGMRQVSEALFPGFAFVRLSPSPDDWAAVKATPGVRDVLRFGAFAPRVPEAVVTHLKGIDGLELDTPGGRSQHTDFATQVIGQSLAGLPSAIVQREGAARASLLVEFLRRASRGAPMTEVIAGTR